MGDSAALNELAPDDVLGDLSPETPLGEPSVELPELEGAELPGQDTFDKALEELNGLPGGPPALNESQSSTTEEQNTADASELVWDIPVGVNVVLGSAQMSVAKLVALENGEVIELNSKIGEPLDIMVNGKKIAKGEITVMEDDDTRFAIRITELSQQ